MRIRYILSLFVLFSIVASTTPPAFAQVPTGTIAGAITDQSGAVISKATVTVTNKDTGLSRVVQTEENGLFSVPSLAPGRYEV